ncbi:MAG: polysaccharide pyruvyl transferase family protein [Chthoniobacteraceae bacterium]
MRHTLTLLIAALLLVPTAAFQAADSPSDASTERPSILLYSGWQTINIGDMGHTLGTLHILERELPDVPVVWWAVSLNDDVRRLHERRFPKVRIVQGTVNEQGEPSSEELREAARSASLIMANSKPGLATPAMRLAKHFGKSWGCYGHSLDADTFTKRPDLVPQFTTASFIFCRDTQTLATVRKAVITAKHVAFGPDGCFGIDVRDDAKADAWLAAHGLKAKEFITIMLRTNTPKHATKDDPLNPQKPTAEQQREDETRAAKLREVMIAWVRETGLKIVIAPEVDKEIAHNKRLLFDPLPDDVKAKVVPRDRFWLPDEAASVFAKARAVVCHEPHSCIIALAMGTPILHPSSLVHGPKREIFRDIGLGEWLLDLDAQPASDVTAALMRIQRDPAAAAAKVKKAMEFVTLQQAATMRVVSSALTP